LDQLCWDSVDAYRYFNRKKYPQTGGKMKIRHQNSRKMNLTENRLPVERFVYIPIDEVDFHRHLDCPYYTKCLCYVCNQPWASFTCIHCPHYISPENRVKKIILNNIDYSPFSEFNIAIPSRRKSCE
jgi:hypothetical protein